LRATTASIGPGTTRIEIPTSPAPYPGGPTKARRDAGATVAPSPSTR
jgi:hypothetical protein